MRPLIGSDVSGESREPVSTIFVIKVWEREQMRDTVLTYIPKFPDLILQVRLLGEKVEEKLIFN